MQAKLITIGIQIVRTVPKGQNLIAVIKSKHPSHKTSRWRRITSQRAHLPCAAVDIPCKIGRYPVSNDGEHTERTIDYNLRYYQSNLEPNVEMAISIQDQQRIFLAYRALFEGQNAHVRQPKAIRKILISSKKSSSPLVLSLGLDRVVSVIKGLLERGIFSSELKAKLAFPVLYETSPEQDARHEASDAGAAREEAEALQEVEALDNTVVEEADAEVSKFEDVSLDKERKLPAAVESLECPVSDNQC